MQPGLQGRRIALVTVDGDPDVDQHETTLRGALEDAGAEVDTLTSGRGTGREWHSARYAGLVLVGKTSSAESQLAQLVREFLLSEKPIAATASAAPVVIEAGGEPRVTGHDDTDMSSFASRVVAEFSHCLEDRDLDEISEESFPASDPPANTPVSKPKVAPDPRP